MSMSKAVAFNRGQMDLGAFTDEMIVETVRAFQREHPQLKEDGYCGARTQGLIERIVDPPVGQDMDWFIGDALMYPSNYADRVRILGDGGREGTTWYRSNIVERQGDLALPGVPPRWYVKVHRIVEPYAYEAFRRAEDSGYEVERVGSFNYRLVRFGKTGSKRLSSHALGIAFDVNSKDNFALDHDDYEGKFPQPFSEAWRRIWPNGVTQEFVQAFESCGFRWGGTYRGWADPMHFEWVGLSGFRSAFDAR